LAENDNVIIADSVSKVFKDFWGRPKVAALTDVSMNVPTGSVFGLLGPNGAGKSTLIKIILGHLFPTAGRVAVLGKPPRDVATKQRIGYLPERSYLYKHLTAEETLRYFGGLLDLSNDQIESRTDQLLEMVGLAGARQRRAGEFSHGMGRRLGLAQALLNDPDLIILDEPTAGLDPVGCREVKDLIITLGKRGKTVLLTSHLLADVEDVCDDVMVLYGGRVVSQGTMQELLADTERTTLSFPNVPDEALAAARKALAQTIDDGDINVSSPTETLEAYFLKLVAKSDASDQHTDGVRMGSGVAEYLAQGGGDTESGEAQTPSKAVETAASKREAPAEAPKVEKTPPTPVAADALRSAEAGTLEREELAETAKVEKTPPAPAPVAPEPEPGEGGTPEAPADSDDIDRGLLDDLTG
jgi:ABC-2 type transport system ATP-binding protein